MENQDLKTLEQLKADNELLTQQLKDLNEKVKIIGSLLVGAKEYNVKLAYSTRLFAELHLTHDEKMTIAQEFDKALNAEQVEKIYYKYYNQVVPPGVELEKDFLWSQQFTRDLEKYYFRYKGENPFELISESANVVRTQFKIEDDLRLADNPDKIAALRALWEENKMPANSAINNIIAVTNEILNK